MQITCNTSSAYHVQHGVLRATWYKGTAQLVSLTEFKSLSFISLAEPLTDDAGKGNRNTQRKRDDLHKKLFIYAVIVLVYTDLNYAHEIFDKSLCYCHCFCCFICFEIT